MDHVKTHRSFKLICALLDEVPASGKSPPKSRATAGLRTIGILLLFAVSSVAIAQDTLPVDDVQKFSILLTAQKQLGAGPPKAIFLPDGERFLIQGGTQDYIVFNVVDPSSGEVKPFLDVGRTRRALEAVISGPLLGRGLPFDSLRWLGDETTRIAVTVGRQEFVLDLSSYLARPASDQEVERWAWSRPRVVRGRITPGSPVYEKLSPNGRWFASAKDGDLWLRAAQSEHSKRITYDGTEEYGWDLEGLRWSPDSRRLAIFKVDRREAPKIPIVRWSHPETPIEYRQWSQAGQPIPRPQLYIVDPSNKSVLRVNLGDGDEPYLHVVDWHPQGRELYVLRMNRLSNHLSLLGVDTDTGKSRIILSERSDTFLWGLDFLHGYTPRVAQLLADGQHFLWKSQRDGPTRLYLYNLDGDLAQILSPEDLDVDLLEFVDESEGWIYFSARSLRAPNPYDISLYRTSFSGEPPELLLRLPQAWDRIEPTRSGDFFLVSRASIDEPPVLELRRSNGTLVRELWRADLSQLKRTGWQPPERFTVNAADGETPLHGLIFRPISFDANRKYPVLEDIYGGPQLIHTPYAMWFHSFWRNQWLAEHGFVVVTLDGRGTPGRGKAFQDVVYERFGTFEITDHAAALEQLAAQYPYIDLNRAGIFGHSWGGYFVLRALLSRPDLYKVGIASAPVVDPISMRVSVEPYLGCLPAQCPEIYAKGSVSDRVEGMVGDLLIIHGALDDAAPIGESMKLASALIAAGRGFDFLPMPEANHRTIFRGPYWNEVVAQYFMEHLGRLDKRNDWGQIKLGTH
jgi:dipeptidyl aminopeptidase/acylaminoacyl peptidase